MSPRRILFPETPPGSTSEARWCQWLLPAPSNGISDRFGGQASGLEHLCTPGYDSPMHFTPWYPVTPISSEISPPSLQKTRFDFPAKPQKSPPPQGPTTPVPTARVNKAALKREKAKARAAAPAITVDYEEWFSRCIPSSETEEHQLSCHVHNPSGTEYSHF